MDTALTLKMVKWQFAMAQCKYLGHQIGHGKQHRQTAKIKAIQMFKVPRRKKDVRAFLGMAGYYHSFVKDYAAIAASFTD